MPIRQLSDGPADARTTIVLAHGAGAGMDHPFLATVARGLAAHGFRVVRFDFPYRTAGKRAPDRMPVLQAAMRDVVAGCGPGRIALAGKSMGGRVATMLADELAVCATVVFGYPFHPPDEPTKLRTAHLADLRTPTLILQGERDEFGTRDDVAGYSLAKAITVQWFADGDHSLVPRQRSGHSAASHLQTAIDSAAAFVAQHTG